MINAPPEISQPAIEFQVGKSWAEKDIEKNSSGKKVMIDVNIKIVGKKIEKMVWLMLIKWSRLRVMLWQVRKPSGQVGLNQVGEFL